jgi:trans-aconitate methyltransferase
MQGQIKNHWEHIYNTKQPNQVSWTQEVPTISINFVKQLQVQKNASIIDVGGGDSKFVDYLLAEGYTNISVLDISEAAINRAKARLGDKAINVNWIVGDILAFNPTSRYDLWHDRAAFHFQTDISSISKYIEIVNKACSDKIVIGTFSVDGPTKCSGLEIKQYEETSLKNEFENAQFKNIECKREDHITPSGSVQNFIFCAFEKTTS